MLKVAREFALEAGEVGVLRLVAALENWADGGILGILASSFLPPSLPLLTLASPKTSDVTG